MSGSLSPFFTFHVKYANLSSISFLSSVVSKVNCVVSAPQKVPFEDVVASGVFDRQYLNDHNGGVRQIIATTTFFLALHI